MLGFYEGVDEDNFVLSPEMRFASAEYAQFRKAALENGLDPDKIDPEDIMLFQTYTSGTHKGELHTDVEFRIADAEYRTRLRWRQREMKLKLEKDMIDE